MAQTHTDTNVNQLVINKMTKQEYNNLQQVSDTELYLVEEQVDSVVTQNSTNPVQSGAVYEALQQSSSNIKDGITTFTKNNETIGTTSANQSVNQTIQLPNDVVMCKMLENRALASYATPITRFKYIEDHGWVDMDRSDIQYNEGTGEWTGTFVSLDITEGEYYYDMDNEAVFVVDENSEMQDVTSTVVIQDDINKLYCDTNTNQLYRYDGSNFVAIEDTNKASNYPTFSTAATRENLLGNGESTTTLWGKVKKFFTDLKAVAFSGSFADLNNKEVGSGTVTFSPDTSAVRVNIASGDTLSQMAKVINANLGIISNTHSVAWINGFSGRADTLLYGQLFYLKINFSNNDNVGINSRILEINITPTNANYTCFQAMGSTKSILLFLGKQNEKLTLYLGQAFLAQDSYIGSTIFLL